MPGSLDGKIIALGVSGGIAAYKAAELLRLFTAAGAEVFVVMSANAGRFVTPLTFEALSGHPVYHEVFDSPDAHAMRHIQAAEQADLLVVAPATAGTIGKMAGGLADDALTNLFAAYRGPVILAPAMNDGMYANPAVQDNIAKMKARGVQFVDPEHGELACGSVGQGRLADPARIFQAARNRLQARQDLKGLKLLVTAGPTQEPLDPVRYLTNPSSGKMGFAVAAQGRARGAEVVLISGPTRLDAPDGVELLPCQRASQMKELVLERFPDCDALVMVAAVGDFAPEKISKEKIKKKGTEPLVLRLMPTPDILGEVAKLKKRQVVVGFAAESENVLESAKTKLRNKDLDLIVANDISAPGIGFRSDSNQVTILSREGGVDAHPLLSKTEIADVILDRIRERLTA